MDYTTEKEKEKSYLKKLAIWSKLLSTGVGRLHGQKTMWRGSAFYKTSPPLPSDAKKVLSSLHGMVGVFETEVDEVWKRDRKGLGMEVVSIKLNTMKMRKQEGES